MPERRSRMDQVSKRIKIRILMLNFDNLKDFHRSYESNGGTRSYHWWNTLSSKSKYQDIVEAARDLGVNLSVLTGEDPASDSPLLREGVNAGRVRLNE